MAVWVLKRNKVKTDVVAKSLGIDEVTASVFANKDMFKKEEIMHFLKNNPENHDTIYLMKDGKKGIDLISNAIDNQIKIMVYGDYDADGVTSTTILYKTIKKLGGDVSYYIPHRSEEGYGLNCQAIENIYNDGYRFIMTCDNGISSIEEVSKAKELGMTVILLDHHEPKFEENKNDNSRVDIIPDADAIIDPKQNSCDFHFNSMCAGGLSYFFSIALLKKYERNEFELRKELLSFACIATICDIVDLVEENRYIVRTGLKVIGKNTNVGLNALLDIIELDRDSISEEKIGFRIGPCINAAGRLDRASKAVDLFVEEDEDRAFQIAKEIVDLNEKRKEFTNTTILEISEKIDKENKDKVLIIYDEAIEESIAGIVAGKIKDKYSRPTIVITKGNNGAKGSARSISKYNIFEALYENQELFTKFGGHPMAAGFSLDYENIPVLRERLNSVCSLEESDFVNTYKIEKILKFSNITMQLEKELRWLAPFGKGNREPLFASLNILVEKIFVIGKENEHIRFMLKDTSENANIGLSAISFGGYELFEKLLKSLYDYEECDTMLSSKIINKRFDFIYTIELNTYNGYTSLQLMIKNFRLSSN